MTPKPDWWTSDEWSTPQDYYDTVNARFGPFTLDACARTETAKAPNWWAKDDNALEQKWEGVVWVNPPYSNPRAWCEKAAAEVAAGNATRVVMLLPAAVDTKWFHECVLPYADVEFIKGRMRYVDWSGAPSSGSPKGGNVLAIFPKHHSQYIEMAVKRVRDAADALSGLFEAA